MKTLEQLEKEWGESTTIKSLEQYIYDEVTQLVKHDETLLWNTVIQEERRILKEKVMTILETGEVNRARYMIEVQKL